MILTRRDQAIELLPTPPPTEAAMEAEREATKKRARERAARIQDATDLEASLIPRERG